ncbi:hypothetical protein EV13_1201 [Prochlorococcus sp. MIT 0702]|nr:hypothetical protein EV12_2463 [Prochlorococcus sp. MIT 0701]KGG29252.1 hypothetical protein EV13_1201 [Prochlorococcus sp. MIT 0702]KGG35330.1 hypothetical protein EV14_0903 [Prochlorococcus sp. MIT 0703]
MLWLLASWFSSQALGWVRVIGHAAQRVVFGECECWLP